MTQGESRLTARGREWLKRVREWEGSGLSMRAFCAARGVNPATLSWWRQELKRLGVGRDEGRVQLVEISRQGAATDSRVELELTNGLRVRVPLCCDGAALKHLLAMLATC